MRHKHKKIALGSLGAAVIITTAMLALSIYGNSNSATAASTCTNNIPTIQVATGALSGIVPVQLLWTSAPVPQNKITILVRSSSSTTADPIGYAVQTSAGVWSFPWDTSLYGQAATTAAYLSAAPLTLDTAGNTVTCTTPETPVYIATHTISALSVVIAPNVLSVPVGAPAAPLAATVTTSSSTTFNPTDYAIYTWPTVTPIGSLVPNGNKAMFSASMTAGQFALSVDVRYGGAHALGSATLITTAPVQTTTPTTTDTKTSTTTPTTTTTTTTDTTTATGTTTTTPTNTTGTSSPETTTTPTTATQIASSTIQVTPSMQSCMEKVLSLDRYKAITAGTSRATDTELQAIHDCLAAVNYIVPLSFSPIDPTTVKNLPVTTSASVSAPENTTVKKGSENKLALKITGKSKPNSIVVVYIYSDPIVITTTTDGEGNWEYTLEDPLIPGKHEVYAVVNKGDGTYNRSSAMSFFISTAAAAAPDSAGLSLQLEPLSATPTQSSGGLVLYVTGSVTALLLALTGIYLIIRHKKKLAVIPVAPDVNMAQTSYPSEQSQPISQTVATEMPASTIQPNQFESLSQPAAVATPPQAPPATTQPNPFEAPEQNHEPR